MSSTTLNLLGVLYWVLVIPTLIWLIFPPLRSLSRFVITRGMSVEGGPRPPDTFMASALKTLITLLKWSLGLVLFWALLMSYPVRFVTWIAGQQHGGLFSNRTDPSVSGYMETQKCLSCWTPLVALDDLKGRFKSRALDFVEFTVPPRRMRDFALDRFDVDPVGDTRVMRIDSKEWNTFVPNVDQRMSYPRDAKSLGYTYEGMGIYRVQLERLPYEECAILQSSVRSVRRARSQAPSSLEEDLAMLATTTDSSYAKAAELVKRGQCPVIRKVDQPLSRYVEGGYNERVLYEDWFHRVYRFEYTKGVDLETGEALYHSVQYCVRGALLTLGGSMESGVAATYCFRADPKSSTPLETGISYPGNLFGLTIEVKK